MSSHPTRTGVHLTSKRDNIEPNSAGVVTGGGVGLADTLKQ